MFCFYKKKEWLWPKYSLMHPSFHGTRAPWKTARRCNCHSCSDRGRPCRYRCRAKSSCKLCFCHDGVDLRFAPLWRPIGDCCGGYSYDNHRYDRLTNRLQEDHPSKFCAHCAFAAPCQFVHTLCPKSTYNFAGLLHLLCRKS